MKTIHSFARHLIMACVLCQAPLLHAATAFTPNSQPTGWVGEVDVSAFDFADGKQVIFKGDYIKGQWTGNVLAFPVDKAGTVDFVAERWSGGPAENLGDQGYQTGRRIVTMNKDGASIPFLYGSLSTQQQDTLDGDTTKGTRIVSYLRGDQQNEKPAGLDLYRPRKNVMGDVIHSRPLFVYDPDDPRVYVGANDGMLHAFDAATGEEVFAYVPSFFIYPVATTSFSHIKALTVDPYVHNYYVDASPNARKIEISAGTYKTILVGGVGPGGKGLYALDISNPNAADETAAASKILWEITPTTRKYNGTLTTNTDYADLGYTYGIPVITKLKYGSGTWVAIVANGYNNRGGNEAVLYVIDLLTGAKIAAITTTSPTAVSDSNPNGLSSPTAVDTNRDGMADYVYAGDINGNLWKFDLTSTSTLSWSATKLYTTSPAQPITGRPSISQHPDGGYVVNFATGRMFTSADATDTTAYYAYGIRDNGTTISEANIVSQTLIAKTFTATGGINYDVRVSSSNAVNYGATPPKQGWKLALPAGERVVGDGGLVTNSRYVFASTNPTKAHAAGEPQGDNWLNEVEFTTGGGGSDPIFDLDPNFTLDNNDRVRVSGGTDPQTGPTGIPVSRYIVGGVMSQPIVARLKTLSETYFNTNPDLVTSVTSATDPGVSGGHFDFDIYYGGCTVGSTSYSCRTNTHVHEYDDKYDVTGVNMQAPSLAAFNIANAIPGLGIKFKILMSNQKYSPAATFVVGGNPSVRVTSYQTTAGVTMASRKEYTRATGDLQTLILALPLDAFKSKDWAGTGDVRAGLVPSQTGCIHSNKYSGSSGTGPWMNGALTIQIVKTATPDSAVVYSVAGDPSMGYRLKKDAASQAYQLAQYTMFWHHPNGKCVGDAGWVKNPPEDTGGTSSKIVAKANGADDPEGGEFGLSGTVASGGFVANPVAGPTSTVTYTFADGSSVTQTTTQNLDGSVTIDRTFTNGTHTVSVIPPNSGGLQADTRAKTGRVSWREMIRP